MNRDEALAKLLIDLDAGGAPSAEWVAEHSGEGAVDSAISRLWAATADVEVMVRLAGRFVEQDVIVGLACESARLALPYLPSAAKAPLAAIETAEACLRGEATWEHAEVAGEAALDVVFEVNGLARKQAMDAAAAAGGDQGAIEAAAREATQPDQRPIAYDAAFAAADAAFAAAESDELFIDPAGYGAAYAAAALERARPGDGRRVADLLRERLPVPTLDDLLPDPTDE